MANAGNKTVQRYFGFMYETGRGFTQDYFKAVKWYRTAAIGLDSYLGAVAAVFHRAGGQISYAKNA